MNQLEKLRDFVLHNLDHFECEGGIGASPRFPTFGLYAQDYLGYAERELDTYLAQPEEAGSIHLINCVSHLKRAVDCQVDTFLCALELDRLFSRRNLKLGKKLDFLQAAGVFSSRSLARLNTIRNKMEHEYTVPEVKDIEAYFDVVVGFVAILQAFIASKLTGTLEFRVAKDGERIGYLELVYDDSEPRINASWTVKDEAERLSVGAEEDIVAFAYFLKVFWLLYQQDSFASSRFIADQLRI